MESVKQKVNLDLLLKMASDNVISKMPKTESELLNLVSIESKKIISLSKKLNNYDELLESNKSNIYNETDMDVNIPDSFVVWLEEKIMDAFYKRVIKK